MKFGLKSMAMVIACIAAICVLPVVAVSTQTVDADVLQVVSVDAPAAIDWDLSPSSVQPQTLSGGQVNIKSNVPRKLTATASDDGQFQDTTNSSEINAPLQINSLSLATSQALEAAFNRGDRNVAITYGQTTTYSDPASDLYTITVTFTAAASS